MASPMKTDERSSCGPKLKRWCKSRRCQLWRLLLLPFIPILALIVQTTLSLKSSITNGRDVADVEEQVSRATELGKLVTRLQQERSEVAFFIFTNGSTLRASINAGTSMTEAVEWYTNANAALLNHLTKEIKDTDSSTIWRSFHLQFISFDRNQQIVDNKHQDGSVADAIEYFDQTATFLDKLRAVQKQLREYIRKTWRHKLNAHCEGWFEAIQDRQSWKDLGDIYKTDL
ncbi:unnamed protein product [Chrysodeixis includens]|uniref:Uncharacterized protein n=1 Tax=Chrysodeixis includens TaxID=689277 RepID=A0A9N8Q1E5_CHRIL|nr:unnamed protein product [Chrysodeixis includens]